MKRSRIVLFFHVFCFCLIFAQTVRAETLEIQNIRMDVQIRGLLVKMDYWIQTVPDKRFQQYSRTITLPIPPFLTITGCEWIDPANKSAPVRQGEIVPILEGRILAFQDKMPLLHVEYEKNSSALLVKVNTPHARGQKIHLSSTLMTLPREELTFSTKNPGEKQ